jgi:hypothetical protein
MLGSRVANHMRQKLTICTNMDGLHELISEESGHVLFYKWSSRRNS